MLISANTMAFESSHVTLPSQVSQPPSDEISIQARRDIVRRTEEKTLLSSWQYRGINKSVRGHATPSGLHNNHRRARENGQGISEWFIHSTSGLAPGFVIEQGPAAALPRPLTLEIENATASLAGNHIYMDTNGDISL